VAQKQPTSFGFSRCMESTSVPPDYDIRRSSKLQCSNTIKTLYSENRLEQAVLWVYGFTMLRATALSKNDDLIWHHFVIVALRNRNGRSIVIVDKSGKSRNELP
jgi:hypothetical protein